MENYEAIQHCNHLPSKIESLLKDVIIDMSMEAGHLLTQIHHSSLYHCTSYPILLLRKHKEWGCLIGENLRYPVNYSIMIRVLV